MKSGGRFAYLLACLFLVQAGAPAVAAPVVTAPAVTVAVADFADDSHDGYAINAPRLSEELARLLVERGQDQFAVAPVGQTREALRTTGFTSRDLTYPSRAAAVAQAAGADWIVTGRWTRLELDRIRDDATAPSQMLRAVGYATVQIRVLDAGSRRVILEETFSAWSIGGGGASLLRQAARGALRRATASIVALQPQAVARTP